MTLEDAKNDLRFLAETDKIRGENIVKRLVQERIGDGSKLPFADPHYSAPFVVIGDPTFQLTKLAEAVATAQAADSIA